MIKIEVVYASEARQWKREFSVTLPCTLAQAIQQSGVLTEFAELNLDDLNVGVFSQRVSLDASVQAGQRIEIYRPLKVDPKMRRQQRAKKS